MKQLPIVGKAITLLFVAAVLVACSGNTKEEDEAAAAAAAAAAAKSAQEAQQQEELRVAEEKAAVYGNVFYFEYDSANLTPEALTAIDAHIDVLKRTDRSVRLEGNTDERGTRDYNLALGERRANSVRDYMVANGIQSFRIETVSYGEERPVAYGSDEAAWSQNRRVELK